MVAVAELGHAHGVDGCDESGERAGTLRDGDGEEGFFLLSESGALGDEAQAVEVHVCAGGDGDELALGVLRGLRGDILLQTGEGERAGGLEDGTGVFEDVFDGGADLVGVDLDDLVDDLARHAESLLANSLDSRAIREETDILESDTFLEFE